MEYRIQVTEKLQHIETVSAASGTEAVELVRQSYKEEKIVLSSEHFSDVAFAVEHQKAQAYYKSPNHDFVLAHGDCFELLRAPVCGRGARRSVLPNGQGAERGDRRPRLLPLAGEPYRRSAKDRRARYGKGSPRRLSPYALLISAISGPAIVSLQTKTSPFGGQRGI